MRVRSDGSHYPKCEKVVQEFWDCDNADQRKAIEWSAEFRARREASLKGK